MSPRRSESLGRSERQQLSSRLVILISHLLKSEFQPAAREGGWQATIKEQRVRIQRLLARNPSPEPLFDETLEESYPLALIHAAKETNMVEEDFPRTCPYSKQVILHG